MVCLILKRDRIRLRHFKTRKHKFIHSIQYLAVTARLTSQLNINFETFRQTYLRLAVNETLQALPLVVLLWENKLPLLKRQTPFLRASLDFPYWALLSGRTATVSMLQTFPWVSFLTATENDDQRFGQGAKPPRRAPTG